MKVLLKTKLTISFLAVIIICGLIASLVGVRLINTGVINQARDKVRNDLNSARQIYREELENVRDKIRFTALRFFIKDAVLSGGLAKLNRELQKIREAESLDILTLTDEDGRVVVRSRNPSVYGDDQARDEAVRRVLAGVSFPGIEPRLRRKWRKLERSTELQAEPLGPHVLV